MLCTGLGTEKLALLLQISSSPSALQHLYMLTVPPRAQAASCCNEPSCCCFGRNAKLTTPLQSSAWSEVKATATGPAREQRGSCNSRRASQESSQAATPVFQVMPLGLVFVKCYLCSHTSLQGVIQCDGPIAVPYGCIYLTCIGEDLYAGETHPEVALHFTKETLTRRCMPSDGQESLNIPSASKVLLESAMHPADLCSLSAVPLQHQI